MTQTVSSRESHLRSVAKAVSYRVIGTVTTSLLTWIVTGDWAAAIAVGALDSIVKIAVYYLHERAWQLVPLGALRR